MIFNMIVIDYFCSGVLCGATLDTGGFAVDSKAGARLIVEARFHATWLMAVRVLYAK